ncbi:MAG: hypothetical protein AAGA71_21855 [Pseudomonadota bacterium]
MASLFEYSLMSLAAYDDRRFDTPNEISDVENYLLETWSRDVLDGSGASVTHTSGLNADIWRKGNEVVIAFRGTEGGRVTANDDFRRAEGILDIATADDWSLAPTLLSAAVIVSQFELTDSFEISQISDIQIDQQVLAGGFQDLLCASQ